MKNRYFYVQVLLGGKVEPLPGYGNQTFKTNGKYINEKYISIYFQTITDDVEEVIIQYIHEFKNEQDFLDFIA